MDRHEGYGRQERINSLKRDLEMRKKMLEMIKKGISGMSAEKLEAEIEDIKRQLRELGIDPDEQQT